VEMRRYKQEQIKKAN